MIVSLSDDWAGFGSEDSDLTPNPNHIEL